MYVFILFFQCYLLITGSSGKLEYGYCFLPGGIKNLYIIVFAIIYISTGSFISCSFFWKINHIVQDKERIDHWVHNSQCRIKWFDNETDKNTCVRFNAAQIERCSKLSIFQKCLREVEVGEHDPPSTMARAGPGHPRSRTFWYHVGSRFPNTLVIIACFVQAISMKLDWQQSC